MSEQQERTLVSFDYAAKYILKDKANFDILEGFLSTLFNQDVKVVSILEGEGTRESESDKFNRIDLVIEMENKELVAIEIQNNRELHYFERLLYGSSKLIVDHIKLGDSYAKVKKVISISILYFLLGEGESDYVYHGMTEFYGLNDHSKLVFKHHDQNALLGGLASKDGNVFPEYYLIETERFQNIVKCGIDEWVYFFKNSKIRNDFKSKNIQLVAEKLDYLNMSEEERRAYDRFLMNKANEREVILAAKVEGRAEGIAEGKDKGEYTKAVKIAQNMLGKGFDISLISEMTGLTEKEIPVAQRSNVQLLLGGVRSIVRGVKQIRYPAR